jgi:hypothetical protein
LASRSPTACGGEIHWQSRGSHYVKTAEELRSYVARDAASGWTLRCELISADVEQDNVKGRAHGSWEKAALLADIRALTPRVGFPVAAYIVSPTPLDHVPLPEVAPAGRRAWLRKRAVLLQEGNYVAEILRELRAALGSG